MSGSARGARYHSCHVVETDAVQGLRVQGCFPGFTSSRHSLAGKHNYLSDGSLLHVPLLPPYYVEWGTSHLGNEASLETEAAEIKKHKNVPVAFFVTYPHDPLNPKSGERPGLLG